MQWLLNGSSGRTLARENLQVRRTERFGDIHPVLDFLQDLTRLPASACTVLARMAVPETTYTLFEKYAESVDLNQYPVLSTQSMPRSTSLRMTPSMVVLPALRSLLYE
jgi:hypothetical protein